MRDGLLDFNRFPTQRGKFLLPKGICEKNFASDSRTGQCIARINRLVLAHTGTQEIMSPNRGAMKVGDGEGVGSPTIGIAPHPRD